MFSVKNKTIIITGARRVIGSANPGALAKEGARTAVLGRNRGKNIF